MHDVDSELIDPDTNAVAVLTNKTGGNLTSVLRFYSVQGNVHNNTVVECIDNFNEESTNVKIVMAGIYKLFVRFVCGLLGLGLPLDYLATHCVLYTCIFMYIYNCVHLSFTA